MGFGVWNTGGGGRGRTSRQAEGDGGSYDETEGIVSQQGSRRSGGPSLSSASATSEAGYYDNDGDDDDCDEGGRRRDDSAAIVEMDGDGNGSCGGGTHRREMEGAGLASASGSGKTRRSRSRQCAVASVVALLVAIATTTVFVVGPFSGSLRARLPSWAQDKLGGSSLTSSSSSSSTTKATPPTHGSYTLEYSTSVPEYDLVLAMYRHGNTDAEVLALMPNSYRGEDKAFGISFRTVPTDSSGVAHILEHSVLSGSHKYPVKDPFLHLLKGSLQTFLNAMTYSDRTVFPVSSRNAKDFANLVDVYLDAVFNPRCVDVGGEWVLKQEGWRYELVRDNDDDNNGGSESGSGEQNKTSGGNGTTLQLRGVVMSEMMGAYSNPDERLYETSRSLLFPDTSYKYDSGGDPKVIPTLTLDQFKAFYRSHYHPTNSKTFVSGDVNDVKMALDLIDTYLSVYEYDPSLRESSRVPYQTLRFVEPVRERRPYAAGGLDEDDLDDGDNDEEEDGSGGGGGGHIMSIQWLLHDEPLSPLVELALVVLDDLLLGDPSSVLRKALLDSALGEDVLTDGLEDELLQSTFTVGLKGMSSADDVGRVETIIMDTLDAVAKEGFSPEDVESSINSVEFKLREFNTGSDPKGIVMFLAIMSKWNYDMDPRSALSFEDSLRSLKDDIQRNGSAIFQSLVQTYLVSNPHRVVLEFYPSSTYEAEQLAEEEKRLSAVKASLSPEQLKQIDEDAEALALLQSTDDPPEAVASIPSLSLRDLDRTGDEHPIAVRDDAYGSGVTLVLHEIPSSSGIAYVDFGLDLSTISLADVPLVPLLARMMTVTGTSDLSPRDLDRQVGMHTGGIDVSHWIAEINPSGIDDSVVTAGTNLRTMLFVRGKCTSDKSSKLFSLYFSILRDAKLNSKQKAIQVLQEMSSDLKTDIPSRGSAFANVRISSRYSVRGYLIEETHGMSRVETIKSLLKSAETEWETLLARLVGMRDAILGGSRRLMVLNLTGDRHVLDAVDSDVRDFLSGKVPLMMPGVGGTTSGTGAAETEEEAAEAPPMDFRKEDHPWVAGARESMASKSPIRDEGVVVSTKVNYVGKGGLLYDVGEHVSGSASVVSQYLQNGYLWESVRVMNGAYGSFASFDRRVGTLIMTSYRDPELGKTLAVFDAAADRLLDDASSTALTEQDGLAITRAVIGAIGDLDGSALSPNGIGWVSLMRWLLGESAAARQRWRSEILNTNVGDFEDFANRLKSWKSSSIAVVGSEGAFKKYSSNTGSTPLEIILTI